MNENLAWMAAYKTLLNGSILNIISNQIYKPKLIRWRLRKKTEKNNILFIEHNQSMSIRINDNRADRFGLHCVTESISLYLI